MEVFTTTLCKILVTVTVVTRQSASKKTNNAKSEVTLKQLIRDAFTIDFSTPTSLL
jgi:hypothetical protein